MRLFRQVASRARAVNTGLFLRAMHDLTKETERILTEPPRFIQRFRDG